MINGDTPNTELNLFPYHKNFFTINNVCDLSEEELRGKYNKIYNNLKLKENVVSSLKDFSKLMKKLDSEYYYKNICELQRKALIYDENRQLKYHFVFNENKLFIFTFYLSLVNSIPVGENRLYKNVLFSLTDEQKDQIPFDYNEGNYLGIALKAIYEIEDEDYTNAIKSVFTDLLKENETIDFVNQDFFGRINSVVFENIVSLRAVKNKESEVYHMFKKTCANGKVRDLYKPNDLILNPLKRLNELLYNKYGSVNIEFQCAYKKHKNVVNNAYPHKDNRYVFKADIKDFFPSCKKELVAKILKYLFEFNHDEKVSNVHGEEFLNEFLDYILIDNSLCLGNPISPVVASTIISRPARYIYNMCNKAGIVFTQYSDDLTFSSSRPMAKQFIVKIFNQAYSTYKLDSYFKMKESKLVGQVGQYRNVTGLAFDHTDHNNVTIRRYKYYELRSAIHHLSLGENVNIKKIKGNIAYMVMIGKGKRILNYVNKFPELVNVLFSPNLINKIENSVDTNNNNTETVTFDEYGRPRY